MACVTLLPIVVLLLAASPAEAAPLLILAALLGGGILAEQGIVYGVAGDFYSLATRGAGMGAAVAAGRVGTLVGPLLAAWLLSEGRSPAQVLMGVLPIVVVCGGVVAPLAWHRLQLRVANVPVTAAEPGR